MLGVPRWLCFDACPTSACLPYVAARAKAITPHAKLVVVVRQGGGVLGAGEDVWTTQPVLVSPAVLEACGNNASS